jgi:hypothetical protein
VARPVISLALPFVCCVLFRVLSRICAMSDIYPLGLLPKARWWLKRRTWGAVAIVLAL